MLIASLVALIVAWLVARSVVHRARGGTLRMNDFDLSGPQKFHSVPVPRIGGVALVSGVLVGVALASWMMGAVAWPAVLLLACAVPAFASGLTEDFTKTQSPRRRLFFTAVSAALACWVLDARITHSDLPGLDSLLAWTAGSVVVTLFVVAGVANSMNIIDGFNGLASMCGMLILAAVGIVAAQVGDRTVMLVALLGIAGAAGFFFWNYPKGRIFLGDGGAYFLGFWVAESAILLLCRNPQVSPLFALTVCLYPVFETLFSMYRRKLRGQPVGAPDGIHLHSLIYRRLTRWAVGRRSAYSQARRNAMTSPYLWLMCALSALPAAVFWDSTPALLACIVAYAFVYAGLYWRIVRFRAPRWMRPRRAAPPAFQADAASIESGSFARRRS
jgi:UDP-N-acetylmuramyl pentapeptide phosphotransferase/UDP-N-acetylglucosamine-1-phosphate transferase